MYQYVQYLCLLHIVILRFLSLICQITLVSYLSDWSLPTDLLVTLAVIMLYFSALNDLADGFPRLCIFGDFNLPLFNRDMFIYPDNFFYRTAADFVCNHGLTQLVDTSTRGNNILDLVLCSDVLSCDTMFVASIWNQWPCCGFIQFICFITARNSMQFY